MLFICSTKACLFTSDHLNPYYPLKYNKTSKNMIDNYE